MPGIIVGFDGSDHSRRALEWAIREGSVSTQVIHHAHCPVVVIPDENV
jgi:nucleotide-binding universal stress UspA family protein